MAKTPYQEPGQRTRYEYVLTEAGTDLLPVVLALFEWGHKHVPNRSRIEMAHSECGAPAHVEVRCEAGHPISIDELSIRVGPKRTVSA